jgi:sugar porter (SP) family MFS transporter
MSSSFVYLISAVAALGGLLFGFDTAVINGAIIFLRAAFHLSTAETEFAAASLLGGCIFGAGFAGDLSDRFGRKRLLLVAGLLFLASAIGAAVPHTLWQFVIARVVGGLAIGVASAISPLYIAEVSPAAIRGRLVTLNQLAIVIGILIAFLVNWQLSALGSQSWRWMFLFAGLPALVLVFSLFAVPESPRWLIQHARNAEALHVLSKIDGPKRAPAVFDEIRSAIAEESAVSVAALWRAPLIRPMLIALVIAVLSQVTGINTILYYGSIIFTEHVRSEAASSALLANVIIGSVNLLGTILAILFFDRAGRRPLLLAASGGMGIALAALGFVFRSPNAPAALVLALILFYVASFAIGLGPGSWLLMSELFPTAVRGRAMSIATVGIWAACLLVTLTFLSLVAALGPSGAFWIYGALCVFTFLFVWIFTPETRGRSLEEIEHFWIRQQSINK